MAYAFADAKTQLRRAKTDRIDAALVAACTTSSNRRRESPIRAWTGSPGG